MPKGVYVRTDSHRQSISKGRLKWAKENPEISHKICSIAGKNSARKNNTLKDLWKNNRNRMMESVDKNHYISGIKSNSLKNLWKNDREKMLKVASEAGKIGGKNNWGNNREKMLKVVVKAGKIGGPISIKKQQKLNPSPIELIVRNYLDKHKIKHRDNVWFPYKGTKREADIIILKYNLIVECDGFRHINPKEKENDKIKNKLFNKLGYNVLRLTGSEIRDNSFIDKLLNKINQIQTKSKKGGADGA
jgi:hypothetical protein